MDAPSPVGQLDGFLDKFTPETAANARDALARLRPLFPGAFELVYDNYSALAIGWGGSDRRDDVFCNIAVFPRWVTLVFTWGIDLPDPHGLLNGGGSQVRHLRLQSRETLDDPRVVALIAEAKARTRVPLDAAQPQRLVIKSVSSKQRPRRPV